MSSEEGGHRGVARALFPPMGPRGVFNIVFPSSPPDRLHFCDGVNDFARGVNSFYGETCTLLVRNNPVPSLPVGNDFFPFDGAQYKTMAGTEEERLESLLEAFSQSTPSIIICGRGGHGASRLLPHLTEDVIPRLLEGLGKHRFVGFSDATFLHNFFRIECRTRRPNAPRLVTVHGPMPMTGSLFWAAGRDADRNLLYKCMRENSLSSAFPNIQGDTLCAGTCAGRLVGGNLACLCACEGTRWATERGGGGEALILLLEDAGETPYRIDRMMMQLWNTGLLKACAGIVLGDFFADEKANTTAFEDFNGERHFWKVVVGLGQLGVPVMHHAPVGHGDSHNSPCALGALHKLECYGSGKAVLSILEEGGPPF